VKIFNIEIDFEILEKTTKRRGFQEEKNLKKKEKERNKRLSVLEAISKLIE